MRDRALRPDGSVTGGFWHETDDGRLECTLCPRRCHLRDGQRGFCFVRAAEDDAVVLTTYGRASGFCIDPIEKKPLDHFLPGTSILSFGTAGCNLGCRFCQNWDISKAREMDRLQDVATPEAIAAAAKRHGCRSVAFTYNDPVIFAEYAMDTALACHDAGIKTVAVTAGYIEADARAPFYEHLDATNVDLKAFTERFYRKLCFAELTPVLDTIAWLARETDVWLEVTTLLIPEENDSDEEIQRLVAWLAKNAGPDVPLHFTAFHPDFKLTDRGRTPTATLRRARALAKAEGLRHVYTGNASDVEGQSSYCAGCGSRVIERDGYQLGAWRLDPAGRCSQCGTVLPGVFEARPGAFGARRLPVAI
jgi:pyruvate formate lyase activating enzyme